MTKAVCALNNFIHELLRQVAWDRLIDILDLSANWVMHARGIRISLHAINLSNRIIHLTDGLDDIYSFFVSLKLTLVK